MKFSIFFVIGQLLIMGSCVAYWTLPQASNTQALSPFLAGISLGMCALVLVKGGLKS